MRLDDLEKAQALAERWKWLGEVAEEVQTAYQHPNDTVTLTFPLPNGVMRNVNMAVGELLTLIDERRRATAGKLVTMGVELPAEPGT